MIYGNDTIEIAISQGYEDERGDWVAEAEGWGEPIQCDAKPNGSARTITLPDGSTYKYGYEITMDVAQPEIPYGKKLRLSCKGKEPQELTCKGFHTYAFQTKLWV